MTQKKADTPAPVVITLTLPEPGCEGTLLIQRGDLAHLSQFAHTAETDFTSLIQQAVETLAVVEADPPQVPELPPPPEKTTCQPAAPVEPPEPVIQVSTRTKKGTLSVPARCLQLPDDETAQKLGLKIAGKLLDSELWDGQVPIRIEDPTVVQHKLSGLTDKELKVLFTLEQFVQVNPPEPVAADSSAEAELEPAKQEA